MNAGNEGTSLASSMTDLMTSLAVIFILLLVASYNNEVMGIMERTNLTRSEILLTLQKDLESFSAEGVRVETDPRDPLGLLVIVPADLLNFDKNSFIIPPGGDNFLRRFTPVLARTVCSDKFEKEISAIVVEGHTDSSGPPAVNLPLSQRRSMTVVQKSLDVLSEAPSDSSISTALLGCYLRFLSASGRGSSEIIINETTGKEDMGRSRRVEFKIRVRSLEQRQQMQEALGTDTSTKASVTQ